MRYHFVLVMPAALAPRLFKIRLRLCYAEATMRLVVGIDIDVWVFVVVLKFTMPLKNFLREYPTENPSYDPTHLCEDAFDGGLCRFILQEDAR